MYFANGETELEAIASRSLPARRINVRLYAGLCINSNVQVSVWAESSAESGSCKPCRGGCAGQVRMPVSTDQICTRVFAPQLQHSAKSYGTAKTSVRTLCGKARLCSPWLLNNVPSDVPARFLKLERNYRNHYVSYEYPRAVPAQGSRSRTACFR